MARFETSVPSGRSEDQTFAYMADFRNVADWDPTISEATLTSGAPGTVGSTYDVTFAMAGQEVTLHYETVEIVPGDKIVMRAESDSMVSVDTITIRDGGTVSVDYRAEIELKGVRKVADPLVDLALTRSGRKAADGLTAKLAG